MKLFLKTVTFLIAGYFSLLDSPGFGQTIPDDTTGTTPKSDSVMIITPEMVQPRARERDTLPFSRYNSADSVKMRLLPARLNLADEAGRSFYHDAGDFLKFSPAYFILENHQTPQRKTAAPFNLPGDRLNTIAAGDILRPLEHLLMPDGQTDLNDIPDFAASEIYSLEGPSGMALGGDNATSSLVIMPQNPTVVSEMTGLIVDKGSFGYDNTKAHIASRGKGGRIIKGALEYRQGDGAYLLMNDTAYHQWGEIKQPLGKRVQLNLSGRLYHSRGILAVWPDSSYFPLSRDRREQGFTGGLEIFHTGNSSSGVDYRFQNSESRSWNNVSGYKRAIKLRGNSIEVYHYQRIAGIDAVASVTGTRDDFEDLGIENRREGGTGRLTLSAGDSVASMIMTASVAKFDEFDPASSGMISYSRNGEKSYYSLSAGYATRIPGQYQLYLPYQAVKMVDQNLFDYFESGNRQLKEEKQLVGNLSLGLGEKGNDILLSVTGGKIKDGIVWLYKDTVIGEYRPGNQDIEFASGSLTKMFSYRDNFHWRGGGSYHYIKVENNDDPAYSPDYQFFSSLELSYQFRKPSIRLYGYIEGQYYGPYTGPRGMDLGEKPIINVKLSFSIKKFRFYYIFQNIVGTEYMLREYTPIPTWYDYFGFTWNFLD